MKRLIKASFAFLLTFAVPCQATVEVTSFTVNERDGTATATISISSSSAPGWLLDYSTFDDTASDENTDDDFKAKSGTLIFAPGDTEEDVVITIVEDPKIEGDEQFGLSAFNLRRPQDSLTRVSSSGSKTLDVVEPLGSGTIGIQDNDIGVIVNIEFVGGPETQDNVTLSCNSGDVDLTGNTSNSKPATEGVGNTASFEVINYGPGDLQCEAYQTSAPPPGYTNTSGDSCSLGFNQSNPSCLIQNSLNVATIEVTKSFSNDVDEAVEVEIVCTSGDVNGTGNPTDSDWVSQGSPVLFSVAGFTTAGDSSNASSACHVREVVSPFGYVPEYTASGDSPSEIPAENPGCQFNTLDSGDSNRCAISNQRVPMPVSTNTPFGLVILTLLMLAAGAFRYRKTS